MIFTIHRGTKEIGGSCVEIKTEAAHLVLDMGLPFESCMINEKTPEQLLEDGLLPAIPGLYRAGGSTTLLISHAHLDHFGLMNFIHPECPVWMGEATEKLIAITALFSGRNWENGSTEHFSSGQPFNIGDVTITPFLMDHSAFDAYSFLIQCDGKTLFYSGDFRLHGRKTGVFNTMAKHLGRIISSVDYLLMEGTTLGRTELLFPTEKELEGQFVEALEESNGISLVFASGQNIDRLVTIFRACRKMGKTLTMDFYMATILKQLAEYGKLPYPSPAFSEIRVFYPQRLASLINRRGRKELLYQFIPYKISREEMDQQYKNIVMLVRTSLQSTLERMENIDGGTFIYSMWGGYRKDARTSRFINYLKSRDIKDISIHTSGHADRQGLQRMVDVLNPQRLVPIHTFEWNLYSEVFENTKVILAEDGECITV